MKYCYNLCYFDISGQIQENFLHPDNSSVDWIGMSKSLTDLPHALLASSQFYAAHFQKYDWQAWADFANKTLMSMASSNPAQ